MSTRFTVCTYNVWADSRAEEREKPLREFLRIHTPDILCLQELRGWSRDLIAEALPTHDCVTDDFEGWTVEGNVFWNRDLFDMVDCGAEDIGMIEPLRRLFWARLRLLTDLPRTAMATDEEAKKVVVVPPEEFPELADVGFDVTANRDPLRISPHHFPKVNGKDGVSDFDTKLNPNGAEEMNWRMTRRSYLLSIVSKIRLQALITGKSIAIMDDHTYRVGELLKSEAMEGEQITLQSVGRNSVIVEVDGIEFKIRLVGGGTDKSVLRDDAEGIRR